jgi:hypothetical protein
MLPLVQPGGPAITFAGGLSVRRFFMRTAVSRKHWASVGLATAYTLDNGTIGVKRSLSRRRTLP